MREMKMTGYSSNRSRQNIASFLINNYEIDWRWGAEYFESILIDHDVRINTGNWATLAGAVHAQRQSVFNVLKQAQYYDADGAFVKLWCPELADVPEKYIIEPWNNPKLYRSLNYPQDRFTRMAVRLAEKTANRGNTAAAPAKTATVAAPAEKTPWWLQQKQRREGSSKGKTQLVPQEKPKLWEKW